MRRVGWGAADPIGWATAIRGNRNKVHPHIVVVIYPVGDCNSIEEVPGLETVTSNGRRALNRLKSDLYRSSRVCFQGLVGWAGAACGSVGMTVVSVGAFSG